jgi:predicted dehydrogenase
LYPEIAGETHYDRLLNGNDLDAIVIATSVRSHFKLAKASLSAGMHTMIEKPMASSSEECEELVAIAEAKGLALLIGHTFLYSPAVRKVKEIVDSGDIGNIRYISSRRLGFGLFQNDINVTWDLAPHDLSMILHIIGDHPTSLNCRGNAHITAGIEDVTTLWLNFTKERSAIIQSSWLDPRKIREMTIVGSKRMIVYDDVAQQEQIKIYDKSVEKPTPVDSFADFIYSYRHGDIHVPHFKQEEPLKIECQHFLDCIRNGTTPLTNGRKGMELVRILEASSESLKRDGAPIDLVQYRKGKRPTVVDGFSIRDASTDHLENGSAEGKRINPSQKESQSRGVFAP